MARNEEKQLGRLNRLWLQQLNEEQARKVPPRPGLGSLHTAAEVKKWLPSIKRDIDFYLKQSQVTCYPERQIEEFTVKIDQLTKEYKAYVRKLRELEPGLTAVPWTDRAYDRKRKLQGVQKDVSQVDEDGEADLDLEAAEVSSVEPKGKCHLLLATPVLEKDEVYKDMYGHEEPTPIVYNADPDRENSPLEFKSRRISQEKCDKDDSSQVRLTHPVVSDLKGEGCTCSQVDQRSKSKYSHTATLSYQPSDIYDRCCDKNSRCVNRDILNDSLESAVNGKVIDTIQRSSNSYSVGSKARIDTKCKSKFKNSACGTVENNQITSYKHASLLKTNCGNHLTSDVELVLMADRHKKETDDKQRTVKEQFTTLNLPYSDSSDEELELENIFY